MLEQFVPYFNMQILLACAKNKAKTKALSIGLEKSR